MNKKKIVLMAVLSVILFGRIAAQDETEPQYLFDLKKVKLSGFGGTITEFSPIAGDFGLLTGGGGAFLFNYNCFLGFYSINLATDHLVADIYPADHNPITNPRSPRYTNMQLSFENNGLWMGYIHNYKNMIHWGINIRIGGGTIGLYDKDLKFENYNVLYKDYVFVATPEVNLELNLKRWFKINLGVGYRFVSGIGDNSITNSNGDQIELYQSNQFNSPYASIKFLFGRFAKRNRDIRRD